MSEVITQHTIAGRNGQIHIPYSSFPEGAWVKVSVTLSPTPNEMAYLLSTSAKRQYLKEAIANLESGKNTVVFSPEEWNEKYNL